jgi:Zn finger protein HypA/HybF involved in hydrogenase expression
MGEVADMMLDGTLCEGCGIFMGDDVGYPRKCPDCERQDSRPPMPILTTCPHCGKRVKSVGLAQHVAAKHQQLEDGA